MSSATTNLFGRVKTTLPGQVNVQSVPTSRVQHFAPTNIGTAGAQLTAYQLMNGALVAAPVPFATPAANFWTAPTAANVLAAYSSTAQKVQVGDVFKIAVFNTGASGINIVGGTTTGVTGTFSAGTGTTAGTVAGAEAFLHINWLAVSSDGTTGVYQLF